MIMNNVAWQVRKAQRPDRSPRPARLRGSGGAQFPIISTPSPLCQIEGLTPTADDTACHLSSWRRLRVFIYYHHHYKIA